MKLFIVMSMAVFIACFADVVVMHGGSHHEEVQHHHDTYEHRNMEHPNNFHYNQSNPVIINPEYQQQPNGVIQDLEELKGTINE